MGNKVNPDRAALGNQQGLEVPLVRGPTRLRQDAARGPGPPEAIVELPEMQGRRHLRSGDRPPPAEGDRDHPYRPSRRAHRRQGREHRAHRRRAAEDRRQENPDQDQGSQEDRDERPGRRAEHRPAAQEPRLLPQGDQDVRRERHQGRGARAARSASPDASAARTCRGTEEHKDGRVPLHTFRADIDYGFAESSTTFGNIGVKVWIYQGMVYRSDKNEDAGMLVRQAAPRFR